MKEDGVMDYDYSAQNSLTIKRLRTNDSITLSFDNNGIPLFQGIDESSGVVSPDWTKAVNQPIRIPKVVSSRGLAVELSNHGWSYNGIVLVFNGDESNGWKTDSTGKFQLNTTTGSIKIIANLASKTNIAGDTLIYSAIATIAGVEYSLTKDLPIVIQKMGASSYYLSIIATTEQLTSQVTSSVLQTKLYVGANETLDYYVKWLKDTVAWTDKYGQKSITIGRADVDGTQLFIAEVYKSASDVQSLARSGIRIIDTADEFQIVCFISSANKEVDTDKPVTVGAKIINMTTGSEYNPTTTVWEMNVMDKENWTSLKSSSANNIIVTTAETDRNGNLYDVDVIAECNFN